jgi:PKD repeat protein
MRNYLSLTLLILLFLQGCKKDDFQWDLLRSNPLDSAQNSNSNGLPIAGFSCSSTSVPINTPVNFLSTSSANTTGLLWEFAGGNIQTSTNTSPVVSYPSIGKYDVKLTASNSFGSDVQFKPSFIEAYYNKTFNNQQWDGWSNNGWTFSNSGYIIAFQNTSNNTLRYSISKNFSNNGGPLTLEFYYNINYSGSLSVKVNNVEVWSTNVYGTGTPSIVLPNLSNFTLSFDANIGYTQSVYLNDIKLRP